VRVSVETGSDDISVYGLKHFAQDSNDKRIQRNRKKDKSTCDR